MGRRTRTDITVFDSDALNPYGHELVGLFKRMGCVVSFAAPRDAPDAVLMLRGQIATKRMDVLRELVSVLKVAFGATPVLIAWARSYQKVLFVLGSTLRRRPTYYVVHNPAPSRWPSGGRAYIERALVRTSVCVTHSQSLRLALRELTGVDSRVAPHPLYTQWVSRWLSSARVEQSEAPRFLLLGRIAPEKFDDLDALREALASAPSPITLETLVRPRIDEDWSSGSLRHVNSSSDDWIPDIDLGVALGCADVLLAPYPGMTESGTVQLALTAGVDVVAFDGGAIRDSLRSDAVIGLGDYVALVNRALRAGPGGHETALVSIDERLVRERDAWADVIGMSI